MFRHYRVIFRELAFITLTNYISTIVAVVKINTTQHNKTHHINININTTQHSTAQHNTTKHNTTQQ